MRRILFRNVSWWGAIGLMFVLMVVPAAVAQGGKTATTAAKVDINNATEKQLVDLPGVGKATADKIIAGRPYASIDDLAKAGLSKSTIAKITPLVTVGAASAAPAAAKTQPVVPAATTPAKTAQTATAAAKVDINNATEKQLVDLPGVGKATADKIIAGRPYASIDDLSKAGVSKSTIAKITPLVTVGAAPVAPTAPKTQPVVPAATTPAKTAPAASTAFTPPPAPGMVWVNLETKVYHKEGDPWYGKTKRGKYMVEADAIKAGYRAAKVK